MSYDAQQTLPGFQPSPAVRHRPLPARDYLTEGGPPCRAHAGSSPGSAGHRAACTRCVGRLASPLALPVLFLVIFALVFTGTAKVAAGSIGTSVYYVPVILSLAIISAAFGNLGPRPGSLLRHT